MPTQMIKCRFVGGSPSGILDTPYQFKQYGQLVEMPEELYLRARSEHMALLTEDEFNSVGHSPEELKRHARFETHGVAPAEFIDRRTKAQMILVRDREPVVAVQETNDAS